MTRLFSITVFLVWMLPCALEASGQNIIYVDAKASGVEDGSSWAAAFSSLQDALASAGAGDQIWVAAGTYRPDEGEPVSEGDRSASFVPNSGVRMHGGFAGGESALQDRDILQNATFLSGDLAADDSGFSRRDENSYHVVRLLNADEGTLLDGFVIRGGHANGTGPDTLGGGVYVSGGSPVITNTRVIGNYGRCGGGVAIDGAEPQLVNVVVSGNRALRGGGVCNLDSSGEIINTTITSNFADTGGGLFNRSSSPAITNSIVSGNRKATSVFDCELMQYPCTIADTPEEIRAATVDVLMDALRVRHASSMEDAIAFLASVPEMAEVLGGNDAIRFRLRGGAPAWLTDVSVGDTSTTKAAVKRPADLKHIPTGAGFQAKVVGEDSNRDGKIDNEDTKRALLLAPFEWQFSSDETRLISGNLMGLPAYEGNVRFVSNPDTFNQNVELADFQSWDDYDFIFVSSHGSRECRESDFTEQSWCGVAINTGIVVSTPTMSIPGILYGVAYSQKEVDELGFTPERLIKVMVTGPFFRTHYPNGLDNSVVILSACETGGRFAGAFAEDLGGEDFVMVAWSEKVPVPDAFSASTMLVEELVNGLTTEEALQKLDEAGLRAVLNNNLETAEFTRYAPNGGDQRIIELPTILHEGKEMLDDTDIALLVEGTPGDEVNDRLNLDLRVKGVLPDKKDQYQIRYEVGGRQATGTYDLASASEAEGYAYVVEHDVDLGFPLESGPLKLEAIVDLPEGGESRFQVDATVGRCFWRLEIGGPQGGVYSGKWAEFDFVTGLITLNPNSGFDPVSSILVELFNPGGTSNLGPFLLSRDGKDDGHSVIFFRGSYDYLTGDGSEKKDSQGNVQFVFPDPSSLSLTSRSEIVIEGSIDGSYWGGPTGDPATWETVNVSVTFRAENFLLPDLCGS